MNKLEAMIQETTTYRCRICDSTNIVKMAPIVVATNSIGAKIMG